MLQAWPRCHNGGFVSYIYSLYNIIGIGIVAIGAFIIYVILAYIMAEDTSMKDLEVVSP
ncbi:hypothetical protein [Acidiplasma cupricumulans]|uniref:hypothetical protein n=1 Tax=Acidiplasma cupricumulans TaxID=312540 RepID=UPI001584D9AC|nr:hypothetical protein [Acidiplasma cupricumulans]